MLAYVDFGDAQFVGVRVLTALHHFPDYDAVEAAGDRLPDFDLMAETALAQEDADPLTPSDLDPDYADLDQAWRAA